MTEEPSSLSTRIPDLNTPLHFIETAQGTNGSDTESTIFQTISARYQKQINCLAVDSTGRFAALGGKKGLYIVDLEDPWETSKTLHQRGQWEVGIVQWNPHPTKCKLIASTANTDTLIWNLEDRRSALQSVLHCHHRPVNDIAWSPFEPHILATCSSDTNVFVWDLRDTRKALKLKTFCAWTVSAWHVRWNRHNPQLLASAHEGEIRLWDLRKEAAPITSITAHMSKITGIDWSYHSEHELLSCSQDKQVKFWNIRTPNVCQQTLQTGTAVARARYTPFGRGVITHAQRGDFTIRLWSLRDLSAPLHCFMGHTDVITAVDWRICRCDGDRARDLYQLVTWAKDLHLRLWAIDPELIDELEDRPSASTTPIVSVSSGSSLPTGSTSNIKGLTPRGTMTTPTSAMLITDLDQELAWLEYHPIQHVTIETVHKGTRTVTVVVDVSPPHIVHLRITFPSHYPHNAAPAFEFLLPRTNLPQRLLTRVREILIETAQYYVERGRPCLESCLQQLVLSLRNEIHSNKESDPVIVNASAEGSLSSQSNISSKSNEDSAHNARVPCPRTLAACWAHIDRLIYFYNPHTHHQHHSHPSQQRPRSYADLLQLSSAQIHPTKSTGSQEWSQVDASELHADLPLTNSLESLTTTPHDIDFFPTTHLSSVLNRLQPSFTKSVQSLHSTEHAESDSLLPLTKSSRGNNDESGGSHHSYGRVVVKDFVLAMPLCVSLAQMYAPLPNPSSTSQSDVVAICHHNASAAKSVGRHDLQQMWELLALAVEPALVTSQEASSFELPWPRHPLIRTLISKLVQHYVVLHDVQTLAMLTCVLALPRSCLPMTTSTTSQLLPPPSLPPLTTPTTTPTTTLSDITSSLKASHSRRTSLAGPPPLVTKNTNTPFLETSVRFHYNQFRRTYAEILYAWGELNRRAEILKFVEEPYTAERGLGFGVVCRHCQRTLGQPFCAYCKTYAMRCIICQMPVRGLSSFCLACGHGGHSEHIREWFAIESKENHMFYGLRWERDEEKERDL